MSHMSESALTTPTSPSILLLVCQFLQTISGHLPKFLMHQTENFGRRLVSIYPSGYISQSTTLMTVTQGRTSWKESGLAITGTTGRAPGLRISGVKQQIADVVM